MAVSVIFNFRDLTKLNYKGLRGLNLTVAALNTIQAIAILLLANPSNGQRGIFTSFLASNQLAADTGGNSLVPAAYHLFDFNLAYGLAIFLLLGALIRLGAASRYRRYYEAGLKKPANRLRWVEYALAGGFMMVTLAAVIGVSDISMLLLIFGINALAGLLFLLAEEGAFSDKSFGWLAKVGGPKPGFAPWLIMAIYIWGAYAYGNGLPAYIYWLAGSIFVLFIGFVAVAQMAYKQSGKWADKLYTERAYILLSFVAGTALAWQVFAGTLR